MKSSKIWSILGILVSTCVVMAGVATGCLILAQQYREEHEQIKSELVKEMVAEDSDEKVMDDR